MSKGHGHRRKVVPPPKACTVCPLVNFKADWPEDRYDLDYGVSLVRADADVREAISKVPQESPWDWEWLLVTRFLFMKWVEWRIPDVDTGEIMVSRGCPPDSLHAHIAETFVRALKLVNQCTDDIKAPLIYRAQLHGAPPQLRRVRGWPGASPGRPGPSLDGPEGSHGTRHWESWQRLYHDPAGGRSPFTEPFSWSELGLLMEVWPAMAKFANMPERPQRMTQEDLQTFHQLRENKDRTRLGRALKLFEEALEAEPPHHPFPSLCVLLETLFTSGPEDVSKNFRRRIAKLLSWESPAFPPTDSYERYRRRAKAVYDERSAFSHGRRPVEQLDVGIVGEAWDLARESLIKILCNQKASRVFADMKTEGMRTRQWAERLEGFFNELNRGG